MSAVDLDSLFTRAVEQVRTGPAADVDSSTKLHVYALFKQATEGDLPASKPRPGFMRMVEQSKHDAWARLRGMSMADAKRAYIEHVMGADALKPQPQSQSQAEPQTESVVSPEIVISAAQEQPVERTLFTEVSPQAPMSINTIADMEARLAAMLERVEVQLKENQRQMNETRELVLQRLRDVSLAAQAQAQAQAHSQVLAQPVLERRVKKVAPRGQRVVLWGTLLLAIAWALTRVYAAHRARR
jgi:acyl-CoA-binding protein